MIFYVFATITCLLYKRMSKTCSMSRSAAGRYAVYKATPLENAPNKCWTSPKKPFKTNFYIIICSLVTKMCSLGSTKHDELFVTQTNKIQEWEKRDNFPLKMWKCVLHTQRLNDWSNCRQSHSQRRISDWTFIVRKIICVCRQLGFGVILFHSIYKESLANKFNVDKMIWGTWVFLWFQIEETHTKPFCQFHNAR